MYKIMRPNDPLARQSVVELFKERIVWMDYDLTTPLAKKLSIGDNDAYSIIRYLKDKGVLVPEGVHGALRLSAETIDAQEPVMTRLKHYMTEYLSTHWLAVIATILSVIALFKK